MPQRVRAASRIESGLGEVLLEHPPDAASRETGAVLVDKDSGLRPRARDRVSTLQPALHSLHRLRSEQRQPFALSLAANGRESTIEIEVVDIQADGFADAQPG